MGVTSDSPLGKAVRDFSPGITPDGLFWLVKVRDKSVKIRERTVSIRLRNVPEVDTFTFYDPDPPTYPGVKGFTSYEQTYTRFGAPRTIRPTSADPTSRFNWAGEMWAATSSIKFTVAYDDGSFYAEGNGTSAPTDFGEIGFERNGLFVEEDEEGENG